MKKIVLTLCVLVLGLSAHATDNNANKTTPTNKGRFSIHGQLTCSTLSGKNILTAGETTTITNSNSDFFSGEIVASGNYFVTNSIQVGLGLGYLGNNRQTSENTFNRENTFILIPSVSYYVPITDKFYYAPSALVALGFGGGHSWNKNDKARSNIHDVFLAKIAIEPARFEYRINPQFALNMSLGSLAYEASRDTQKTDTYKNVSISNYFAFSLMPTFALGIVYYFN